MVEADKIKELKIENQRLKRENEYLIEKYVIQKCYSGECTILFNNETRELRIFPTNGKTGTLSKTSLSELLKSNEMYPYKVQSIVVEKGVIASSDASYLFALFENCKTMDVKNLDTSQVTNMAQMFDNCSSVTELDLSGWNTSQVTDMRWMFWNCKSLTMLNASSWNILKIEDAFKMFYNCKQLKMAHLSNRCDILAKLTHNEDLVYTVNQLPD